MNIMTTVGNFLIYSARSPENNHNTTINWNLNHCCSNVHLSFEILSDVSCNDGYAIARFTTVPLKTLSGQK